jgi:hypothetical protein
MAPTEPTKPATPAKPAKRALPLGYRNNNPGNIEYNPRNRWNGLADPPRDDYKGRFCRFKSAADGIRVIAYLIIKYQDAHLAHDGTTIDTIRDVIERWAPTIENNVEAYVRAVDKIHPAGPYDTLDFRKYEHLEPLVRGIIEHENGNPRSFGLRQWYTQEVIDEGLRRAGVVPRPGGATPKKQDAQMTATTAAAVGSGTAAVSGIVIYQQVSEVGRVLRDEGKAQESAALVITGAGVSLVAALVLGVILFRKWKAKKDTLT